MQANLTIDIDLTVGVTPAVLELARVLKGGMSDAAVQAVADRVDAVTRKVEGMAQQPKSE